MLFRLSLLVLAQAVSAAAQAPDTLARAPGATVSGFIHDSVAGAPLAGATVQLVGSDSLAGFVATGVSDSLGWFALHDVPEGRFLLGFFHAMLDSLGLAAPARAINVSGRAPVRADLAIPPAARLHSAICGPRPPADSSAVVIGFVRDAHAGSPLAGVTVAAEWLEVTLSRGRIERRIARVGTSSRASGWYALCDVPGDATVFLVARRGADSTDHVEVQVPADGLLRHELYLGSSRAVGSPGVSSGDTLVITAGAPVGNGSLSGTVTSAAGGRPLAGARVQLTGGRPTVTNDRGEWLLVNVPTGTRMLEVRAVGHFPERRRVDIVTGAAPVRVALSTLKAVLDTVRVTASRLDVAYGTGFADRSRGGMGRFISRDDVARRQPLATSDLLSTVPGVRVERTGLEAAITMRGIFTSRCLPAVYIDGHHMRGLSGAEIDTWVHPEEIAGVEIYSSGLVPPQFDSGMSGCGSIVFWTQPRPGAANAGPLLPRVLKMLAVAAVGLALGSLLY